MNIATLWKGLLKILEKLCSMTRAIRKIIKFGKSYQDTMNHLNNSQDRFVSDIELLAIPL